MGLVVNTNLSSLLAQKNMRYNSEQLEGSLERMSTGRKINRSSDDASGMAITKILDIQLQGINRGKNNAEDGSNLLMITESSYNIIAEDIQRIRELTIQAANATNSSAERWAITLEVRSRIEDMTNVAESTIYNDIPLLGLSAPTIADGYKFTIGPNENDVIDIASAIGNCRATALNGALVNTVDFTLFSNQTMFSNFITSLDDSIDEISNRRSRLGAMQTQLDMAADNLSIMDINVSSARSRLRDTDMAEETAEMVKYQIMRNASVSVLSQANNVPKLILGLLQ
ncbi:MAG: flagellin [Vampirovibrionia bacterium]